MDLIEVKKLIQPGESETLEFKKSTAQLKEAVMTLCAFLNHRGGMILIGANQKGELIGQDITDATRQEIARELAKIEPPANSDIEVDYLAVGKQKYAIALQANPGPHMPYTYDGRAFQRTQSTTSKMPQHRYDQLLKARGQLDHVWEEVLLPGYTIGMLDAEEVHRTVAEGVQENRISAEAIKETIPQILKRLKLTRGDQIKRAAVVLFSKEAFLELPQCMVKMARFKGTDKLGDFIDNQQIQGNVFHLLKEADHFLRRHLPIASVFKTDQFKRIDKPALPILAVREALINALCHRDYSNRSASISLAIFDDRLEIWNNGVLPQELKLEDLKHTHDSLPRNKLIAKVFYTRGLIETWGTGTNKMINLCKEEGLPEPDFELRSGGLAVTFKFKEILDKEVKEEKQFELKGVSLLPKHHEILNILMQGKSMSAAQIREKLSNPPVPRTLRNDLGLLKKLNLIESRGRGLQAVWFMPESVRNSIAHGGNKFE